METQKIKRYRLGVSRTFPATHPRRGEETFFIEKIENNENLSSSLKYLRGHKIDGLKVHTIRANYPLWENRIKEVKEGDAVIELFYWSGKPYNSPQVVFATLDKDSGCGVQELHFDDIIELPYIVSEGIRHENFWSIESLAKNDGLSFDDFKDWFKSYDLSKPMAIIHFTKFRY